LLNALTNESSSWRSAFSPAINHVQFMKVQFMKPIYQGFSL
jgi:hypothetical protein